MDDALLATILRLPVEERRKLAYDLWDGILEELRLPPSPYSPEMAAEVRRRLAEKNRDRRVEA